MLYFIYPQLRKLSGAERLILRLAAHTSALGTPVTLLTHYFDGSCRPELDSRVRLVETGLKSELFRNHYLDAPLEYFHSLRLLGLIGRDAEAVTFFGPPSLPALFGSMRIRRRPLPHLYFCYEPPRFIYDDTEEISARLGLAGFFVRPFLPVYKYLDRLMARSADGLLANSDFGASRLRAAYQREATVITHGVDLTNPDAIQVENLRSRYKTNGKRVLLAVNFLHPRKRLDLLLRALKLVLARLPDTTALIVGSGPENDRLRQMASELDVEKDVEFTGFVPDAELPAYYALADLYVHTAKLESFGLSVLEASAMGVAVVSVNEGGPCEIIQDGKTGYLVPADADSLAQAITELLLDPARRSEMGAAGRKRAAENYSWERGARTFLETVHNLQQTGTK